MASSTKIKDSSVKTKDSKSSTGKSKPQQQPTQEEMKSYGSSFGFTEEQIKMLLEAFKVFDKDNDMIISPVELQNILSSLGIRLPRHKLEAVIRGVDSGRKCEIGFEKFLALMSKRANETEDEELKEVFEVFDLNGDGRITTNELSEILSSLGEEMTPDEVSEMIKEADANQDGAVDFKEFLAILSAR